MKINKLLSEKKFLSQLENYFKTIKKSPELFQIKHKHFREVFIKNFLM